MHSLKVIIKNNFLQRLITGLIFLIIFFGSFIYLPKLFCALLTFILLEILFFEWPKLFKVTDPKFWLIMPIYPILPFCLIYYLNTEPYKILLATMFILVFSFDSGSYVLGKLFGKHRIWYKISPGKTWEGFLGGILTGMFVLAMILFYLQKPINLTFISSFALTISCLSLAGDLFESFLKRRVGIKDSGNLLPGHGGFLDRFDSIFFVVFLIYIFRDYLLGYLN